MFGKSNKEVRAGILALMGLSADATDEQISAWVAESKQHSDLTHSLCELFGEEGEAKDFDLHASVKSLIETNATQAAQITEFEKVAAKGPAASRKKGTVEPVAGDPPKTIQASEEMQKLTGIKSFNLIPTE